MTDRLDELRIDRSGKAKRGAGLWLLVGLLVVAAAALAVWLWSRERPPVVQTAVVQEISGGGRAVLNASGYVTARRKATVSSKVTGKVVEVNIEEGMTVQEGQVLARLDDTLARASLALAEAQRESAQRALRETEVRLHEANLQLKRTRSLAAEGVARQADLDTAQAEVDALEARLAQGREEVAVADRLVALRRRELEDTVIHAPFAGVVVSKDAQPGEMISPVSAGGGFTRTGIGTIVDMRSLEIEVDVNESYIARVRPGQRVEAILDAYPDWHIPAHVITTIPTADRQKATVKVRIAFNRWDARILPDMGVKVSFLGELTAETRKRLAIPRSAVRQEEGRAVVYVLRGDRLERRAVTVGASSGDTVEVAAGLAAGEQVVTETTAELKDGATAKVRRAG